MTTETKTPECESYKIEGNEFETVKALAENYVAVDKENTRRHNEANEALFKGIADALGKTPEDIEHMTLNRQYEHLGIYIVEESCSFPPSLKKFLSGLAKKAA